MRSNKEWRYWGKTDPLWAVASWPGKDLKGQSPWTIDEFRRLGEEDFQDILHHWVHYGMTAGTCIEIGCGAGRMTGPLLSTFPKVVALDVSPEQTAIASTILGERAQNVDFRIVTEPRIPVPDSSCTAVFSCHVFQHFSALDSIVEYLRDSFRALEPGGTLCIHVPVPGAHRSSARSSAQTSLHNTKVRLKRFFGMSRIMEYHRYCPGVVFDILSGIGFVNIELRIFPMTSNGDDHSFFFGRKPGAPSL
jgi:SAM-dependent methyltransferase